MRRIVTRADNTNKILSLDTEIELTITCMEECTVRAQLTNKSNEYGLVIIANNTYAYCELVHKDRALFFKFTDIGWQYQYYNSTERKGSEWIPATHDQATGINF